MATNYERGRAMEYRARDDALAKGALAVVRSAGSKTKIDLVVIWPALYSYMEWPPEPDIWLVQVKRDGKLPADERETIVRIAGEANVQAYLASAGPGGRGVEWTLLT